MNITIKDIAKIANVSYATVSRALNGHKDVSEKTRKRVLEICESIGYSPNAIARGLVKKTTSTIGLMVPDITNPFFPEVAWSVEDEANKRGYNVFLCNTNWELEKEETYFKLLLEKRVEGIVIAPVSEAAIEFFDKYSDRIPIVFIGSSLNQNLYNFVVVDNFKGGFKAAEYLISLGHKKIAFVGGNEGTSAYTHRLEGFKAALKEYGLEPVEKLIKSGGYSRRSGYDAAKYLFSESEIPTAILGVNDSVALGVMEAMEETGLGVPEDISLVGFDDIPYASLPKIMLTTVSQPKCVIGKTAVDILFDRLEHSNSRKCFNKVLQPKLIIRTSCGKV